MTEQHTESNRENKQPMLSEFSVLAGAFLEKLAVPKQDIEKNTKVLFSETVSKMDLVTRDELDRQRLLLKQAQAELAAMKDKIKQLESRL